MFFSFGFSDFQDISVLFYGFKIMPISKCVKEGRFLFCSGPIFLKFKKRVMFYIHGFYVLIRWMVGL
jgi:hypothetical protein